MKSTGIARMGLLGALLALAAGTAWAVSLATSIKRHGHDEQLRAGHAVAVGDVTGDGVPDLIVGAPAFEAGQAPGLTQNADSTDPSGPAGEVLIYRGTLAGLDHEPLLTLHGEARNDRFGTAIRVANVIPDAGATQYPDLIVSALFASGHDGAPYSGCVYIFKGPLAAPVPPAVDVHPDAEVCGTQYREHFGRSLEVGEFDADAGLDIAALTEHETIPISIERLLCHVFMCAFALHP